MHVVGGHHVALVALSILIAIAASYTALDLAGRMRHASLSMQRRWLAAGAVVMGGGIWSMHFIAMLALKSGMVVSYDPLLTLLSFLIALAATGAAFLVASGRETSRRLVVLSGVFMGLGIVGMHYTGMSAMRMSGQLYYDYLFVGAAIIIAIGASVAALWLAFRRHSIPQRIVGAIALGIGVASVHYVAMIGITYVGSDEAMATHQAAGIDDSHLAVLVTGTSFIIFVAAILAAMYDRRFVLLAEREALMWREDEERYRTLYRRTPLPLHSLGADGRIEQVSDKWLDMLGYQRNEVIGRPLTDFMTPESARQRNEEHWPLLLGTGELREAEYKLITREGRQLDCVLSAVAERDSEGRLTKTLCGLIDISERRQAEEALRQAQKLEAVGQLTGGIAHDFNNLLAVILGNLELASKRAPDDPRLRLLLGNTMQAAQRGAALTQRMLAFARRQDLNPQPVDVPELVLGMAELMRRSIGPSVKIETRFPLGLPRARVDANQLELSLLNLAVNARDAMPDGGSIVIAAREEEIDAASAAQEPEGLPTGRYFCLTVTDDGVGMDEETLSHATEPFFTTKGIGKGTGLGLAMVHGLAAQSGGRLVLTSRKGEGTTAAIYLPIADEMAKVPAVAPPAEVFADCAGARILVVDDDPLVLSATVAMLEDLSYVVTEASSAQQALNILDGGAAFDVVLTDQAMPGMTGVQLYLAIRRRWPDLPVILGTGYAELPPEAGADLKRLGKPFGRDALEQAISVATRRAGENVVRMPSRHG
ncbi:response regulator [Ancylobacter sp. A5.8]|uniref:MHYT domain-containing protein n=1 Tax=Ancylobacter gelatini TaxID=2919920 RepID=UPI001F4E71A8|nr:MHYT domain-containing protein [Ancylobacter gelatini]MCJ8141930.1 response regulator [Ancylobacter gelatini]